MRTLTTAIVPILLLHLLLTGSSAQAQPQFATVRLVTSWTKATTLFITKGQQPIEEMELQQRYTDCQLSLF